MSGITSSWGMVLESFFVRLFNECFPLNFHNKQQEALKNYTQGKLTICDYSARLEELFTVVRHVSNREKVVKLFNRFRKGVQKRLYLMELNSETSEWDKVIEKATYVEWADSLDWDDKSTWQGESSNRKGDSAPSIKTGNQQGFSGNHKDKGAQHHPKKEGSRSNSFGQHQFSSRSSGSHNKDKAACNSNSNHVQNKKNKCKLTKEEEAEYWTANKCFSCGGVGHFSHNCPQGKTTKSGSSKPLRMKSFSIHVPTEKSL